MPIPPVAICIDSTDMVYVSETHSVNADCDLNQLSAFDNNGKFLANLGSLPVGVSTTRIFGMAVDKDDNLYVCDSAGGCVRVY